MGVMTWGLMGSVGVSSKNDTTGPATQVGPRTFESGLGGHEAGVFGDDEGVEKTSIPLRKQARMTLSECVTFSDFVGIGNDYVGEKRNYTHETTS